MAEPSQEELVEIANRFLLSSPPGEFMEVVTGKSFSCFPLSKNCKMLEPFFPMNQ
jgi:hypothetical protein